MKRISSRGTYFYKKVFPFIWFGFLAIFLCIAIFGRAPTFPFVLLPIVMATFGYFLFRKLLFSLADEVIDGGDYLIVKKGTEQERIALRDIMNVSYTSVQNPPRVTLTLRRPGVFGDEIAFALRSRFAAPFRKDPIVVDLIKRIDEARQRGV